MGQGVARATVLLTIVFFGGFSFAAPDEAILGAAQGYPVCPMPADAQYTENCLVGMYSHYGDIFPARVVAKAPVARALKRSAREPEPVEVFMQQNRNTGLLVMRGDTVYAERYQYGRKAEDRFTSMSMAKSVISLLIGIAVAEGKIASIDDPAERYVPVLKGHPFGETSIRHLLTMTSGVRFTERYDGKDDVTALAQNILMQMGPGGPDALLPFNLRERPAGERYAYSSAETVLLGYVVRGATGRTLSDYLSEKIWQPMGAESDASWNIDKSGYEVGYCCLNATLRDWGRLGMVLANGGSLDGRQIVPADWLRAAVAPSPVNPGYGYQFWITPAKDRRFALLGIRGQAVYVHPETKTVVVHTAVHKSARDPAARAVQRAFFDDILKALDSPRL
jgi:CubicO group peptidase (beta-lactamase class C family)